MKKNLLFTLLTMLLGVFVANAATEVTIKVDKANNVIVSNSSRDNIPLEDGTTTFSMESSENPITLQAADGAEIVSVIANGNPASASGDGVYRIGVGGPSFDIEIVTSGNGAATGPQEKYSNFSIYCGGEGITGAPYTLYVKKDGEWSAPEAGDWGMPYKALENAEMKITPQVPYQIEDVQLVRSTETFPYTREDDGSVLFTNTIPDYGALQLTLKLADNAISFTVSVDYPKNISAFLEWQRNGVHDWEYLTLNSGVNTFHIVSDANPLEFIPVTGGEILQVTRNGVVTDPIGWEGSGGYLFNVEEGDAFVVSTKGPEIEMTVKAQTGNGYNAELSAYYFAKGDGTQISLSGTEATLKANQGEYIYVSPRPGTTYDMLLGQNGAETAEDWKSWFRVTPGIDGQNPATVTLYGKRNVTGVVIDVDNASRVSVVQEGGRGEALTLADGTNNFALADLKNALAVSSTEGNQITGVTLNGDAVTANAQGFYMVNVAESDYVQVKSRKNPVDVALTFELNDGAAISWLSMQLNGQDIESVSPLTVKSYSTVTVAAAPGYEIESLSCNEASVKVSMLEGQGIYYVEITSADITSAKVSVSLKETAPEEGYAIVVPNGDKLLVKYRSFVYNEADGQFTYVATLENNTVNQVKIGDYVEIYRTDGMSVYESITVNGKEIEDLSERSIKIKIEGRTEIDTKVVVPVYVYSQSVSDPVKHVKMGTLEFEVDGQRVKNFNAVPGMTVKIIPMPETGYVFDHAELFYPLDMANEGRPVNGDTYTFTQADCSQSMLLFQGVFKEDETVPVYVVRTSTAWTLPANGEESQALGRTVIILGDQHVQEYTGQEGETIQLAIDVDTQEAYDMYEVAGFCLMDGFPNARVSNPYTISAADANGEGVIWINGLMQLKGQGAVGEIAGDTFRYDATAGILHAADGVKVYSINGELIIDSTEAETSVAGLVSGVYVAVSNGNTIKFVRK